MGTNLEQKVLVGGPTWGTLSSAKAGAQRIAHPSISVDSYELHQDAGQIQERFPTDQNEIGFFVLSYQQRRLVHQEVKMLLVIALMKLFFELKL